MLKGEERAGLTLEKAESKELNKFIDRAQEMASNVEPIFQSSFEAYEIFTYFLAQQLVVNSQPKPHMFSSVLRGKDHAAKTDALTSRLGEIIKDKPQKRLLRDFPDKDQDVYRLIGTLRQAARDYYRAQNHENGFEEFKNTHAPAISEMITNLFPVKNLSAPQEPA